MLYFTLWFSPTPHLHALQFVYVSVRGIELQNVFSIIIWDMIFEDDLLIVHVPDDASPIYQILDLNDHLKMTNVMCVQ